MTSPTNKLKKPILTVKRDSLLKYTPIIIRSMKRIIQQAPKEGPSAKKTCLEFPDEQSISHIIIQQTPEEDVEVDTANCVKFTSNIQVNRCQKHEELPEHKAEGLPQFGDEFSSPEAFLEYTTHHAKNWFFYYVRQDSHNLKTSKSYKSSKATTVVFTCRFHTRKYKSQSKGLRKRSERQQISCPAGVNLKCAPGTDVYKVHTVCHHHRHELSSELFEQLPHGYRLPQELKEEIQDLAHFNVDPVVARRYIESKIPGISLKKTIYNMFMKIRNSQTQNTMPPERVQEMLEKIKYIKANFTDNLPNKPRFTAQKAENSFKMEAPRKYVQDVEQSVDEISTCNVIVEDSLTEFTEDGLGYTVIGEYEEYQPSEVVVQTCEMSELTKKPVSITAPFRDYKIGDLNIKSDETDDGTVHTYQVILENREQTENASANIHSNIEDSIEETHTLEESEIVQAKNQCFSSNVKCDKRHGALPEHDAPGLVQVGDTFSSMEEFARYAASHSLQWFFYYQVAHSRNVKTTQRYNPKRKTWYNFTCRFNKGWYKSQSTGARKVKQKSIFCPAMVNMTCSPGEDAFRVVYVCHHHSHELSYDVFSREAHGHRLPPELKDEIRELELFNLDRRLMRAYFLHKTGIDLRPTIKNVLSKMRRNKEKFIITPEKEREILEKINEIKQNFDIPKRTRSSNQKIRNEEDNYSDSEEEGVASRVEARLNNILYDRELIQSVKELQEKTGCEIHIDPGDRSNVSTLQSGLTEETYYDSDDTNTGQIEVDQEVYPMDENVYYVSDNIQSGEVIYKVSDEVDNTLECGEILEDITDDVVEENIEDNGIDANLEVHVEGAEIVEENNDFVNHEDVSESETKYTIIIQPKSEFESSAGDNDDVDNKETTMNLNETTVNINETNFRNDIGVQVDWEIIGLEKDSEIIKKMESDFYSKDLEATNVISVSTRGRPKVILDEGIINKYNIEFYMSIGGVAPCIENLSGSMGMSVIELLKKVYQGEAVFKMTSGRSGNMGRKTVQLTYVPVTVSFPLENCKYINGLQEYKSICSKYADLVHKLEETIESMSTDPKVTKKDIQSDLVKEVNKNYQELQKAYAESQRLLKESNENLSKTKAENKMLVEKVKKLESNQWQKVLEPKHIVQTNTDISIQGCSKLKQDLNDAVIQNIRLVDKINSLEEKTKTNIKQYKDKIEKLEDLYLTDSQSLLHKIKTLEEENKKLLKNCGKPS